MGLTFLRHTTPDVAKGTCYGRTDLGLAATFEDELAQVLNGLPKVDRIVCSPLIRCRTLAERVATTVGLSAQVIDGLTEMDFGRWEMVPWSDISRDELDAWATDFMGARPHGGESVQMLRDRVAGTIADLGAGTLVVTHSGVIRAAAAIRDHPDGWEIDVKFGGMVRLDGKAG